MKLVFTLGGNTTEHAFNSGHEAMGFVRELAKSNGFNAGYIPLVYLGGNASGEFRMDEDQKVGGFTITERCDGEG